MSRSFEAIPFRAACLSFSYWSKKGWGGQKTRSPMIYFSYSWTTWCFQQDLLTTSPAKETACYSCLKVANMNEETQPCRSCFCFIRYAPAKRLVVAVAIAAVVDFGHLLASYLLHPTTHKLLQSERHKTPRFKPKIKQPATSSYQTDPSNFATRKPATTTSLDDRSIHLLPQLFLPFNRLKPRREPPKDKGFLGLKFPG